MSKVLEAPIKPDLEHHPKAASFYDNVIQLDHEITLLRLVPEMKEQLKAHEKMREVQLRMLKAAIQFDPYFPPNSWHKGFLQKPSRARGNYSIYTRAMPPLAIERYAVAKGTGLFDCFMVYSSDPNVFETMPELRRVDPVLVGWIGKEVWIQDGNVRFDDGNSVQGFLIAQWDLGKDLQAGGLLQLPVGDKSIVMTDM